MRTCRMIGDCRNEPPVLLVKWYDLTKWLLERVDRLIEPPKHGGTKESPPNLALHINENWHTSSITASQRNAADCLLTCRSYAEHAGELHSRRRVTPNRIRAAADVPVITA